jgi:hypothetical protein
MASASSQVGRLVLTITLREALRCAQCEPRLEQVHASYYAAFHEGTISTIGLIIFVGNYSIVNLRPESYWRLMASRPLSLYR